MDNQWSCNFKQMIHVRRNPATFQGIQQHQQLQDTLFNYNQWSCNFLDISSHATDLDTIQLTDSIFKGCSVESSMVCYHEFQLSNMQPALITISNDVAGLSCRANVANLTPLPSIILSILGLFATQIACKQSKPVSSNIQSPLQRTCWLTKKERKKSVKSLK